MGAIRVRDSAGAIDPRRFSLTFLVLLALSVLVGAMIGLRAPFGSKMIFYVIMIFNTMMIMYLVLLRNMTYGVIIFLYALIFLELYWRIDIPSLPDVDIPRITFTFLWLIFLIEIALGRRNLLPRTKAESAMLALLAAVLISMFFMGEPHIGIFLRAFAIPYAMFVMVKNVIRTRKDVDRLVYLFALPLAFYFPMNHFFERFKVHSLVFPRYILSPEVAGQAVHFGERTLGVFLQPVATGMAMISMFLLAMYGLSRMRGLGPRLISWFLVVITPPAVFLSFARSVYTGFAISLIIVLTFSKKLKVYALVILLGAGLAVMGNWSTVKTSKREEGGLATVDTAKQRLVLLQASFMMFADHPFFGVGFYEFDQYSRPYVRQVRTTLLGAREAWQGKHLKQHNHFLNTMTELGLMGLVPQVLIFYFVLRILYKARKVHDSAVDHDFVVVVWAIMAEYLTNAMFMEPRYYGFMNALPFLLAGIVVGSYQRKQLGDDLSPI
jgi:O-antigen ligase